MQTLVQLLHDAWPVVTVRVEAPPPEQHEAAILKLDCGKASGLLRWRPKLLLKAATRLTAEWYGEVLEEPGSARSVTERQIVSYERSSVPDTVRA